MKTYTPQPPRYSLIFSEMLIIYGCIAWLVWNSHTLTTPVLLLMIFMVVGLALYFSIQINGASLKELGFQTEFFLKTITHYPLLLKSVLGIFILNLLTGQGRLFYELVTSQQYFASVCLQEILLLSFFCYNLTTLFHEKAVQWIVCFIFVTLHLPNIPLALIAGVGAYLFSSLFMRYRNIFALILIHYVLSNMLNVNIYPLLKILIPVEGLWSMNVGPSYGF